jgi:TM2 domain-containing membrane protein YozV
VINHEVLALLVGGLGAHKFYLGRTGAGIAYLLFSWTFIPSVIAFVEGIVYLTMAPEDFNAKYNALPGGGYAMLPGQQQPQQIVVNVAQQSSAPAKSVAEELKALNDLRMQGALTEEEFADQKRKLLGGG